MDPAQFNQLLVAIGAAINPAAPAIPGTISPYEGGALNLASRSGLSLFDSGKKPLSHTFDGKLETLYQFQACLQTKIDLCLWDTGNHDIINVEVVPEVPAVGAIPAIPAVTRNLLTEYGSITVAQMEAARDARVANANQRAQQNALMMFECIYESIIGDAKDRLIGETDLGKDGPILLHNVLNATFTATFSSAQSTRDNLANFDPKRLKYDIPQINNTIRVAIKKIRSAGAVTDQEIFHFQFKIYKRIKSPAEWPSYLMHLENNIGTNPAYNPDRLFTDVENQHSKLVNQGLWKPADRSPEEQAIAMIAQTKTKDKAEVTTSRNTGDDNGKQPPFIKLPGKEGETKEWKKETYHYCPSKNHKHGHWHKHKVSDCNTLKKELAAAKDGKGTAPVAAATSATAKDTVTVDKDQVRKGMAALFPAGDVDAEDLSAAFMAAISN
jgi:hypothetical protein